MLSPFMDNVYKAISLFLILFAVVIIIVGIVKIHELPGMIARKRKHPQHDAIQVMSILGLLILPLWFMALIWAYSKPARVQLETDGEGMDSEGAMSADDKPAGSVRNAAPEPASVKGEGAS